MSTNQVFLFVWFDVLSDYTPGMAVSLAQNKEEAIDRICSGFDASGEQMTPDEMHHVRRELEEKEPVRFNAKTGFFCWGGG